MRTLSSKILAVVVVSAMLMTGLMVISSPAKASPDEWGVDWLDGYQCRKYHNLTGSVGAGENYTTFIEVINGTGTDGTDTYDGVAMGKVYINSSRPYFEDVRFTDDDGITQLGYFRALTTPDVSCVFAVKVYDSLNSDQTIYIYWQNPLAMNGSAGTTAFMFFDDFLDGHVWERLGNVMHVDGSSGYYAGEHNVLYDDNSQLLAVPSNQSVFKDWFQQFTISSGVANVGYAESEDGLTWTMGGYVIQNSEQKNCPAILKDGSTYYLYCHAGWGALDRWVSNDGMSWTKDTDNTFTVGTPGRWDDGLIGNIYVWKEGTSAWYMVYEARRTTVSWALGLATSSDGKVWSKYGSSPLIGDGTTDAVGGPFVHKVANGTYYCWAGTSSPTSAYYPGIGRWHSTDLHTWVQDGNSDNLMFWGNAAYEGYQSSFCQLGDPGLVEANGQTYIYYSCDPTQLIHNGLGMAVFGNDIDNLANTYENQRYQQDLRWWSPLASNMAWMDVDNVTGEAEFSGESYPAVANETAEAFQALPRYAFNSGIEVFGHVKFPAGVNPQRGAFGANNNTLVNSLGLYWSSWTNHKSQIFQAGPTPAVTWTNSTYQNFRIQTDGTISNALRNGTPMCTEVDPSYDYSAKLMNPTVQVYEDISSIDVTLVYSRHFVNAEPVHGDWSDVCVYSQSGPPGPGPGPGPTGNYGDMAWIFIFLAMGVIFLGFIIKKGEEMR